MIHTQLGWIEGCLYIRDVRDSLKLEAQENSHPPLYNP